MAAANIPTAAARVCTTPAQAEAALDEFGAPYVVKDDGLAAGKGVVVTSDRDVALAHAASCRQVVIEEFLDGPEVSLFCITDGDDGRPAGSGAGLQAHRRRRHRPEHRRDGRLRTVAVAAGGHGGRGHADGRAAGRQRDAPPRHSVQRPALRRPGAHEARAASRRVQRAIRRSGDAGRAGACSKLHCAACCTRRRRALWQSIRRWRGATARRSRLSSRPRATRARHGSAIRSPGPISPASSMRERDGGTTARSCRPVGGWSRRRRPGRRSTRPETGRMPWSPPSGYQVGSSAVILRYVRFAARSGIA